MTEVTEEDHELVNITVWSHFRRNRSNYLRKGYELGDLFGIAYEALLIAKKRHDPSKAPLHYFQRVYIRGYLLNALNRQTHQTSALDEWVKRIPDENSCFQDHIEREHELEQAKKARDLVVKFAATDRDVYLVKLVFVDGLTRHEAAKLTEMQYPYCTRRMLMGLEKIREYIEGDTSRLERECETCGVDINSYGSNAKFCSRCAYQRQSKRKRTWHYLKHEEEKDCVSGDDPLQ